LIFFFFIYSGCFAVDSTEEEETGGEGEKTKRSNAISFKCYKKEKECELFKDEESCTSNLNGIEKDGIGMDIFKRKYNYFYYNYYIYFYFYLGCSFNDNECYKKKTECSDYSDTPTICNIAIISIILYFFNFFLILFYFYILFYILFYFCFYILFFNILFLYFILFYFYILIYFILFLLFLFKRINGR
jgi:hypothetical protein